ncbi:unnamed protein product [Vitrella brassicaformis CCMP3155]|uniref:Large ribosomal subunit protein eL24-related N-terminal domain-containing protein n=2 Tax=Vitrella brassicaformis TaxID=1169539 RepID=A0A0G4ESF2_VITBC|nr:unnamed protein product [Vitrella brassicaformis CCMP3155]|mmetsp:Transcript_30368/g.75395  ORF Transcript_30368/g.75395 Transcript_30368/m.75395 type:complete len:152 (+) Transcript_30368:127-582(+)|eukprot:CEM00847.1 unnamed protein product [Vitrella brassicaformis CCMP3155]
MVIKTESCSYSEYRVYPGRGQRFIARDGKNYLFINSKTDSLHHQRIKPVKLTWTQAWRRMNKKGKVEEVTRRKTRRTAKVQKAIVGLTLEDIKRKRAAKPVERRAAQEVALKEAKARQQKRQEAKTKFAGAKAAAQKGSVPKGGKGAKGAR